MEVLATARYGLARGHEGSGISVKFSLTARLALAQHVWTAARLHNLHLEAQLCLHLEDTSHPNVPSANTCAYFACTRPDIRHRYSMALLIHAMVPSWFVSFVTNLPQQKNSTSLSELCAVLWIPSSTQCLLRTSLDNFGISRLKLRERGELLVSIKNSSELNCFFGRGESLPVVSYFGDNSVVANNLGILLYERKLLGAGVSEQLWEALCSVADANWSLSWIQLRDVLDSIGYPRIKASGESSTTKHRLLHASGPHPIPPPNDPNGKRVKVRHLSCRVSMTFRVVRTNQYNQDLGLIHSINGNHLESPNEGSSIDHQVTIHLHAQNITMFPTNETWYFASKMLVSSSGGLILILTAQSTRNEFRIHSYY
ncbi:putative V-type proton ATPase subunit H [Dorcoceras hygrometricum]|uniref:Putative V-type proton ATPase subunit H n=1 Tax=Dorcoceras hygrometricum TaxID=472368 RepID=A0A2Z7AMA0_9LAMI|nr:putative V-type proton ATPase subunit H [Dorcoceras hygrometricum]